MTTQPPPSAADLLEQCAEALRKVLLAHTKRLLVGYDNTPAKRAMQDAVGQASDTLAAIDSHIADVRAEEARTARGGVTEAVRALVAKWRAESAEYDKGTSGVIRHMADELEAALSAAPVTDTSAVRAPHEGRKTT